MKKLQHSWALLKTIMLHKLHVAKTGRRLGVTWRRVLLHDLSKLSSKEFPGYRKRFHEKTPDPKNLYDRAWQHHLEHNDHHWEATAYKGGVVPMPEQCVREMVADWFAAGIVYNGSAPNVNDWAWLKNNSSKMKLHHETFETLTNVLKELGANDQTISEIRALRSEREQVPELLN